MTLANSNKEKEKEFIPYSTWSHNVTERIRGLVDECLDRFKQDKKTCTEMLKLLSKLQVLVEKKYKDE
jgi:3-methyladenine DNA glycosylase AlkC